MEKFIYEKFIYEKQDSISKEICNSIIELFEENIDNQCPGVTSSGQNPDVKDTMDFAIPKDALYNEDSSWNSICNALTESLQNNINVYLKGLNNSHPYFVEDNYKFIPAKYLTEEHYQIQKYKKGQGKYRYHEDFIANWERRQFRVITFLWYLNTVEEGGETELLGTSIVKPEAGKLLLFPASWTFPHRGKMPISDDKYIVTGWFHIYDEPRKMINNSDTDISNTDI